jgi:uncharacterized repeat protein (TIGR03803 family)
MKKLRDIALMIIFSALATLLPAQTFQTLDDFNGTNGSQPNITSFVQGTNGRLYGTTPWTVFDITPTGTLTTLADLTYNYFSTGGLIQATDGNFYGTTVDGGANNGGTIFKITPGGTLTTLYSFCAQPNCSDGQDPQMGVIQAANGSLYGITAIGGESGYGTIYKITLGGMLTTVHSFCSQSGCPDGSYPTGPLVQASDGNLYGAALTTLFKLSPNDVLTTINKSDGSNGIFGGLIQATDGNFYASDTRSGNGSIVKITPSGVVTTLYSFCSVFVGGQCLDGSQPYGGLIQASDGNFYGTTNDGGSANEGTIFKLTPKGALTTLYNFCSQINCDDGSLPFGGLTQATNGIFYGTTFAGGSYNDGIVYSLSTGLAPFVEPRPTSGKVGTLVKILGTDLTETTSVSFNGTKAAFEVLSSSEISSRVPDGGTTGKIEVTTPTRTFVSNAPFHVTE